MKKNLSIVLSIIVLMVLFKLSSFLFEITGTILILSLLSVFIFNDLKVAWLYIGFLFVVGNLLFVTQIPPWQIFIFLALVLYLYKRYMDEEIGCKAKNINTDNPLAWGELMYIKELEQAPMEQIEEEIKKEGENLKNIKYIIETYKEIGRKDSLREERENLKVAELRLKVLEKIKRNKYK